MSDAVEKFAMFESALRIEEPWKVMDYKFHLEKKEFHIYLNFNRGAKFHCPSCGNLTNIHDIVLADRVWRHLDFWDYKTYIHARIPRTKCHICKKVLTVAVNWARPRSGFTKLFEKKVTELMEEMSVAAVARKVGEHDTRLWRIYHLYK